MLWSVSLWRGPDDVSHCRILSPDKTEWQLISATLCGWGRCFVADQLWLMTCIREEEVMSHLGLKSWEFVLLRYHVKISNDNFTVHSLAPPRPVRRPSKKLTTSVSTFLLLHGGCSRDGWSRPVCSTSSYTSQQFVHMCNSKSLSESQEYRCGSSMLFYCCVTIS